MHVKSHMSIEIDGGGWIDLPRNIRWRCAFRRNTFHVEIDPDLRIFIKIRGRVRDDVIAANPHIQAGRRRRCGHLKGIQTETIGRITGLMSI